MKVKNLNETKQRQEKSFSIQKLYYNIYKWFNSGAKPPNYMKKSIFISILLFIVGFSLFTFTLLSYNGIYFTRPINSYKFAFLVSLIALIPGVYSSFYLFCCWRKIPGYDWESIAVY